MNPEQVSTEQVREAFNRTFVDGSWGVWVGKPNEYLEGEVPQALIDAGRGDRVLALLDALAEGVFL